MQKVIKIVGAILIAGGVAGALVGLIPFFFGNKPPLPHLEIEPKQKYGYAPLNLIANGSKSSDPDGDTLSFEWRINGIEELEKSSLLEKKLSEGGKYRLEFVVYTDKHSASPRLELISVLPPLKDIEISPLNSDLVVNEPEFTLVLPEEIITNGFRLEINSGAISTKKTQIIAFQSEKAASGNQGSSGSNGANGRGGDQHGGSGSRGQDGVRGGNGTVGKSASDVVLNTGFISGELIIKNTGQAGGDGGHGGNGGNGGNGTNGRNRGGNALCTNARSPGNGGKAGKGGNAGAGGNAGNGGNGGAVIIVADDLDAKIEIETTGGTKGNEGQPGNPGSAGTAGKGGRGGHCGGGGSGGASNSAGSPATAGTVGTNGTKGEIKINIGGVEQIYEVSKTVLSRQK